MTPDLTSSVLEENPRIRGIAHELCNQLAINREQTKLLKKKINELKVNIQPCEFVCFINHQRDFFRFCRIDQRNSMVLYIDLEVCIISH
jgi:hypothetical protein